MKKLISLFILTLCIGHGFAQIDKEQLALDVSKAETANKEQLEALIWKRYSTATVDGEVKAKLVFEVSFNEEGKLQATKISEETTVKKKPGIRGVIQQNTMEANTEYIEKALKQSLAYVYMSKGELLDFFERGTLKENKKTYEISGNDVYVKGDKLSVTISKETLLFLDKTFSSKLEEDNMDGQIIYETFSSGISHGSLTKLHLPAKNLTIDAENKDYSKRIQ